MAARPNGGQEAGGPSSKYRTMTVLQASSMNQIANQFLHSGECSRVIR